jgi:hypothetical protein
MEMYRKVMIQIYMILGTDKFLKKQAARDNPVLSYDVGDNICIFAYPLCVFTTLIF